MKPAVALLSLVVFLGTKHFKCNLVVGNECLNFPVSFSTIVKNQMTLSQKADSPLNEKHSQMHSNTCYGNARTNALKSLNAQAPSATFGMWSGERLCCVSLSPDYSATTARKSFEFSKEISIFISLSKITLLTDFNLLESTPLKMSGKLTANLWQKPVFQGIVCTII